MKTLFLTAIIFIGFSATCFAQNNPVVNGALKDLKTIKECKNGEIRVAYLRILQWVLPEQIGTTKEELFALAKACMDKSYAPRQQVENLKNGVNRKKSIRILAQFIEQSGVMIAELGVSSQDQAEIRKTLQLRLDFNRRLKSYPTYYPR